MQKQTAQNRGEGATNENLDPCTKTQPEVYGKVKWMATSERVNFFYHCVEKCLKREEKSFSNMLFFCHRKFVLELKYLFIQCGVLVIIWAFYIQIIR